MYSDAEMDLLKMTKNGSCKNGLGTKKIFLKDIFLAHKISESNVTLKHSFCSLKPILHVLLLF